MGLQTTGKGGAGCGPSEQFGVTKLLDAESIPSAPSSNAAEHLWLQPEDIPSYLQQTLGYLHPSPTKGAACFGPAEMKDML